MSKISELSDGGSLLATDDLIVVRSGGNVRARLSGVTDLSVSTKVTVTGTSSSLNLMESDTTDTNHRIRQNGGDLVIQKVSDDLSTVNNRLLVSGSTGDISFYNTTGQAKLTWDASEQSLGIGTSNPSTKGHFYSGTSMDQLSVDGAGAIETGINFKSGGTTYGQIYFNNVSPYDMSVLQQYSTGSLIFGTNDTERLRIDSSGNVGIGTSSPSTFLDIDASQSVSYGATSNNDVYFEIANRTEANGQFSGMRFLTENASGVASWWNVGAISTASNYDTDLVFQQRTGSATYSEAMRIDSTGRVGIGTTSPANKFVVAEGTNQHGIEIAPGSISYIQAYDRATSDYGDLRIDAQTIAFATDNGLERMRIDSIGNLIVGNTSDSAASSVTLQGDGDIRGVLSSGAGGDTVISAISGVSNGYQISVTTGNAQTYKWFNGGTQSMTLDSGGNLLVGTTTSPSGSGSISLTNKLTAGYQGILNGFGAEDSSGLFYSGGTSNGYVAINSNGSNAPLYISLTSSATATTLISFSDSGAGVGSITTNGTTTTYNTSSDARLKENITDAEDASSLVDAIKVRQFDWKADGSHQDYGMVAQELQGVAPEAVSAPEDPDEMMGVDYSKLVPMLIKEIQSLRARVQQLENN